MNGRYLYTLDGAEVPIEETFTRDGVQWSACRRTADVTLSVQATMSSDGDLLSARVDWVGVESVGVDIARRQGSLSWLVTRTGSSENGPPPLAEHTVPSNAHAFLLLRCFQGATIRTLAAAGHGGALVVVPDIADPSLVDRLLTPRVDRRHVTRLDDGSYLYVGGSYDSGATCTVGADGLLERYIWDQPGVGVWDVRLRRRDVPLPS